MPRIRPFLLLFLCLTVPIEARAEPRPTYSVAIGNNAPPPSQPSLQALRFADDDAVRFYKIFRRGGQPAYLLTSLDAATARRHRALRTRAREPTLARLRSLVRKITKASKRDVAAGKNPAVFLSFSGHGIITPSGQYAFVLNDAGLTQKVLYEEILAPLSHAQVHLIIDACHAGGVVGMRGAFDDEREAPKEKLTESEENRILAQHSLDRFPHVGALIATAEGQEAHEWSRIEGGVFSYEVASALLGAGDINGDHAIEYSEVEAFIASANRTVANPKAVPQLLTRVPVGAQGSTLIHLDQLADTTLLVGRSEKMGRFYVELRNGLRWLEAHVPPGAPLTLALPRGSVAYVRSGNLEAKIPAHAGGRLALSTLSFQPTPLSARGAIDEALRHNLFEEAFTRGYYLGFVDSRGRLPVDFTEESAVAPLEEEGIDAEAAAPTPLLHKNANEAPPPAAHETSSAPARRLLGWGLTATSGVAGAVSIFSGVRALQARHRLRNEKRERQASEYANQYSTFGTAAWIAGAAALGAGVGAVFVWPRGEKRKQLSVHGHEIRFSAEF